MPASYLHQSIAKVIIEKQQVFDGFNMSAFLAGSEGPDPLFFTLVSPKGVQAPPEVGHLIHTQNTNAFLMSLFKGSAASPTLKSFVLGFLSHYATDTIFHPYIYSKSFLPDGKCSGDKHCSFEHVLDTYVYRLQGHKEGLPVQMGGYIGMTDRESDEVAELFARAISANFPEHELTVKQVRKSFKDSILLCKLLKKECEKKSSLLLNVMYNTPVKGPMDSHRMPNDTIENITAEGGYSTKFFSWDDVINAGHREWHSYWEPDRARNEGFAELYGAAVDRGTRFIRAALSVYDGTNGVDVLTENIGDMSYDSGISWRQTGAIK